MPTDVSDFACGIQIHQRDRIVPHLEEYLNLDGLRVLQRPRDLFITAAASIFMWYVICYQVRFTLLAFDVDLPLRAAYLIVTMAVIGLAVPTPGGVGGFHKATQVGLTSFFAVELNLATAIAIVYHAICFVPITVIGLLMCLTAGVVRLLGDFHLSGYSAMTIFQAGTGLIGAGQGVLGIEVWSQGHDDGKPFVEELDRDLADTLSFR